jgi:hypothetical protein
VIVVLEDMQVRVDWLLGLVGNERVAWSETVSDFLPTVDAPTLVILDHDLGGVPMTLEEATAPGPASRGRDGLTGLDAAERMPVVSCPVLVWSVNPVRAPQMVATLRRRGMRALWAPFGTVDCTAAIVRVLARSAP